MRYFVILVILLIFFKCRKDDGCGADEYNYNISMYSKIDTVLYPDHLTAFISRGEKLVFNYMKFSCPKIITVDGGNGEALIFEISPLINSFSYKTSDLAAIKCYYRPICAVCDTESYIPISGSIEGKEISERKWEVTANLVLKDGKKLNFSNLFIL